MSAGNIYCARHEQLVVLKFVGEIRYKPDNAQHVSGALDAFLDQLFEQNDFDNVLIDLTETQSIDSTNLGLLAKITKFTMAKKGYKATILSTQPDINEILESVGFDQVFVIVHQRPAPDMDLDRIAPNDNSDAQLARLVLDAHRTLTTLNEKNKDMFKSVVQVLEMQIPSEGDAQQKDGDDRVT